MDLETAGSNRLDLSVPKRGSSRFDPLFLYHIYAATVATLSIYIFEFIHPQLGSFLWQRNLRRQKTQMKQMILMVYPEIPTTYWSFDHALPFIGKKSSIPPLGLMTVAAMLPPKYEVRLIDLNVTTLERKDIESADIVFISAMIVQKQSFEQITALCRECNRLVVGRRSIPHLIIPRKRGCGFIRSRLRRNLSCLVFSPI